MKKILVFTLLFSVLASRPIVAEGSTLANGGYKELDLSENNDISFDEMIEEISSINNLSYDEVHNDFIENHIKNKLGEFSYSTMDIHLALNSETEVLNAEVELRNKTYTTNVWRVTVHTGYHPTLHLYFETDTSTRTAKQLLNVTLNRRSSDSSLFPTTLEFDGTIFYHLETNKRVFIIMNGYFYKRGNTTSDIGASIGVGKTATIRFSVSKPNGKDRYIYKENRYEVAVGVCSTRPDFIC